MLRGCSQWGSPAEPEIFSQIIICLFCMRIYCIYRSSYMWTQLSGEWCILGLHEFISQVLSRLTSFSISSLTSSPITMSNIYAKVDQYSLSMLLKILPRLRQGPEPKYRGGTTLLCSLPEITRRGSAYIIFNSNLNASLLASRPYPIFKSVGMLLFTMTMKLKGYSIISMVVGGIEKPKLFVTSSKL